jgi:hypothetical protein
MNLREMKQFLILHNEELYGWYKSPSTVTLMDMVMGNRLLILNNFKTG